LAKQVEFARLNLIEPFGERPPFHVIFCRNVMMYFDKPTQQDIVRRLSACLERGGYLMVGHSESLTGIEHALQYVRPATYRNQKSERGSGFLG
jgi:chemotaxis protein methyltransferase CheR